MDLLDTASRRGLGRGELHAAYSEVLGRDEGDALCGSIREASVALVGLSSQGFGIDRTKRTMLRSALGIVWNRSRRGAR